MLGLDVQIDCLDILDVLNEEPLDGKHRNSVARFRIDFTALETEIEPGVLCKVDSLTDIESHREPSVVGAR